LALTNEWKSWIRNIIICVLEFCFSCDSSRVDSSGALFSSAEQTVLCEVCLFECHCRLFNCQYSCGLFVLRLVISALMRSKSKSLIGGRAHQKKMSNRQHAPCLINEQSENALLMTQMHSIEQRNCLFPLIHCTYIFILSLLHIPGNWVCEAEKMHLLQ
jgi:hypothetical protein